MVNCNFPKVWGGAITIGGGGGNCPPCPYGSYGPAASASSIALLLDHVEPANVYELAFPYNMLTKMNVIITEYTSTYVKCTV